MNERARTSTYIHERSRKRPNVRDRARSCTQAVFGFACATNLGLAAAPVSVRSCAFVDVRGRTCTITHEGARKRTRKCTIAHEGRHPTRMSSQPNKGEFEKSIVSRALAHFRARKHAKLNVRAQKRTKAHVSDRSSTNEHERARKCANTHKQPRTPSENEILWPIRR